MDGRYIGKIGDYHVNIGNGSQIKTYLDQGYSIYLLVGSAERLIAEPQNTFYENVYSETINGDIIVATPEDGWIGLNKEYRKHE